MNDKPISPFVHYWNGVDAAMEKFFGMDACRAGVSIGAIETGYIYGLHPADLALSVGEKQGLRLIPPA